jgi:hypothetical protein
VSGFACSAVNQRLSSLSCCVGSPIRPTPSARLFGSEEALGGRASLSTGVEVTTEELVRKRCRTSSSEHQDMADLSVFDPPVVIRVVRAPGMRGT